MTCLFTLSNKLLVLIFAISKKKCWKHPKNGAFKKCLWSTHWLSCGNSNPREFLRYTLLVISSSCWFSFTVSWALLVFLFLFLVKYTDSSYLHPFYPFTVSFYLAYHVMVSTFIKTETNWVDRKSLRCNSLLVSFLSFSSLCRTPVAWLTLWFPKISV